MSKYDATFHAKQPFTGRRHGEGEPSQEAEDPWQMQRALGLLGRGRLAALAAGSAAVTASALCARSDCLSINLDEGTVSKLKQALGANLESDMEATLAAASTSEIIEELRKRLVVNMNTAFVFAKPHANTPEVRSVIEAKFKEKGIKILSEGDVTGEEIDSKGYIDQHYYAIAEKSTLTSGKDLPVNAEKFKGTFGEDWSKVVAEGRAFNALEFKKKFSKFSEKGALDKAWDATSVDKKTRVKLGGGFYCGQIDVDGVKYCEEDNTAVP